MYRVAERLLLFHGTATGRDDVLLKKILKTGLDPNPRRRVFEEGPDTTLGGVYFTKSLTMAMSYARDSVKMNGGNPLLIAARIELRTPTVSLDEDVVFDPYGAPFLIDQEFVDPDPELGWERHVDWSGALSAWFRSRDFGINISKPEFKDLRALVRDYLEAEVNGQRDTMRSLQNQILKLLQKVIFDQGATPDARTYRIQEPVNYRGSNRVEAIVEMTNKGPRVRFGAGSEGAKILTQQRRLAKLQAPDELWFEDRDGNRVSHDPQATEAPDGAAYMFSQFPDYLETSVLDLDTGEPVVQMHSGWPEDLVLAMANDDYLLGEAILIVSQLCSRCLNVMSDHYGLGGYPLDSPEYRQDHTECEFCDDVRLEVRAQ